MIIKAKDRKTTLLIHLIEFIRQDLLLEINFLIWKISSKEEEPIPFLLKGITRFYLADLIQSHKKGKESKKKI